METLIKYFIHPGKEFEPILCILFFKTSWNSFVIHGLMWYPELLIKFQGNIAQ